MMNRLIQLLEKKVSQLLREYETIKEENTELKKQVELLQTELEGALGKSSHLKEVESRIGRIINSIDTLVEREDGNL
ncbi:MAG: hypothetical protein GXO69_09710 [Acidobacteria bacterium]|nr:hypothetical protein [Acidobacteriota bacterium]